MRNNISPEFATAIVKAQGSIEGAKKGKSNPAFRSKYADLGAVWDAVREALQEQGLAVLQFVTEAPTGYVGLETVLVYSKTGELLSGNCHLPVKDATNAQAAGSAITYARRYALSALLGVCPEDDDGNAASIQPAVHTSNGKKGGDVGKEDGKAAVRAAERLFGESVAGGVDAMKKAYKATQGSAIPEPDKSVLLNSFAEQIKAAQKKVN